MSSSLSYQAGDVVWTTYGAGVIVGNHEPPTTTTTTTFQMVMVRLWRFPGKSIGSAALAFIQESAVSNRTLVGAEECCCCGGNPLNLSVLLLLFLLSSFSFP